MLHLPSSLQIGEKISVGRFIYLIIFTLILLNSFPKSNAKQFLRCELTRELLNLQFSKTFLSNCE